MTEKIEIEFDEICRLCICDKKYVHLFSSQDLETPNYSEIASHLGKVEIRENDCLPQGICRICAKKLIDFYAFTIQIQKSRKELECLLIPDVEMKFENNIFEDISETNHIKSTEIKEEEFTNIQPTNSNFDNNDEDDFISTFQVLIEEDAAINKDKILCTNNEGDDESTGVDDFFYSQKGSENTIDSSDKMTFQSNAEEQLTQEELEEWQNKLDFWVKKQSKDRMKERRKGYISERVQCKTCFKSFSQKSHLNSHMKIHLGVKDHSCNLCEKSFIKKSDLVRHSRVHKSEGRYLCTFCGRDFKWIGSLEVHINSHTGNKPHYCKFLNCTHRYASEPGLRKHCKRYHSGQGLK